MKKKTGIIAAIVIGFFALSVAFYFFLGIMYKDVYPAFIWVKDIYCTGKTPEEVNEILMERYPYEGVTLIDVSGKELHISPKDVDLEYSYLSYLEILLENRSGFNWWKSIYRPRNVNIEGFATYDEAKLRDIISNWDALKVDDDRLTYIEKGKNGYELVNRTITKPVFDNIVEVAGKALWGLESKVELKKAKQTYYNVDDCYEEVSASSDEKWKTSKIFSKIERIQTKEQTLSFAGENVEITGNVLSSFILTADDMNLLRESADRIDNDSDVSEKDLFNVGGLFYSAGAIIENGVNTECGFLVDGDGNLIISCGKIYDFACSLAKKYNTERCIENYLKGVSDEILIKENRKGDGVLVDAEAEYRRLLNTFSIWEYDGFSEDSLTLLDNVKSYKAQDILGRTFIDVDMNAQYLTYYVDGKSSMEMPVVTGNVNRRRGTPAGVYNVYNKRYHTYLRGVDYVSYVNYWLGVEKGVGIHDADWRSEFGGEIYKTDGSHGCINCPIDKVSKLWEVAEVGTPVILHY